MAHTNPFSLTERLSIRQYSRQACRDALNGKAIPEALGHPLHRLCVIHGIRYHTGFGAELRGLLPVFTRSLNARNIMDNTIPDLGSDNDIPYCIWHPATASEDTYRKLLKRYPQLKYHVARACAVAGYADLYRELDVLPDVHVAEEARECGKLEIFEDIISKPVWYSVMNDYERTVKLEDPQPARLNGDTAVRWMLDVKQGFHDATSEIEECDGRLYTLDIFDTLGFEEQVFDLTEDLSIDEEDSDGSIKRTLATRREIQLLSEPLPVDLPTVQKDVLILMAAYSGDIDRYARLRRPKSLRCETLCCMRGIYHSPFFAAWWAKQPGKHHSFIERAINASFVMNNVLSRAPFPAGRFPYSIWWPRIAQESTYRHLAKVQPVMVPQIARACIYANYVKLFDELLDQVVPDQALMVEAKQSWNLHFRESLNQRAEDLGVEPADPPSGQGWKLHISSGFRESTDSLMQFLGPDSFGVGFEMPYDGLQCTAAEFEMMACLPEAWKLGADDPMGSRFLDYVEWPPMSSD